MIAETYVSVLDTQHWKGMGALRHGFLQALLVEDSSG